MYKKEIFTVCPEYLHTAATPVGVTSGRHKNIKHKSCEVKSGAFHSFMSRLNDSSTSRAAPVPAWRTCCRIPVCAWLSLGSVTFNS